MLNFKYSFHGANKPSIFWWRYAPCIFQTRLESVFFNVVRSVSLETVSTISNSIIVSASSCILQFSRPSGAARQASCTKRAAASPFNTLLLVLLGRVWFRAASRPISTHFCRVRSTVRVWALKTLAMSASFQPPFSWASSAINKLRARLKRRAGPVPVLTKSVNSSRASFSKVTLYIFAGISSVCLFCERIMPHFFSFVKLCLPNY